jgi:hypothetical protein
MIRHCEEPTGPAFGRPDDGLRDEAIQSAIAERWIASRSLSSGAQSRDPLARNDGLSTPGTPSAQNKSPTRAGETGRGLGVRQPLWPDDTFRYVACYSIT